MNVTLGKRWEDFVENAVRTGRFGSASDVICEGLRLMEEQEAKLLALRQMIEESIAEGGELSSETVRASIRSHSERLRLQRR